MSLYKCLLVLCLCLSSSTKAQNPQIILLDSGKHISLRGLSIVNDKVFWCSGSKGSVGKSIDGGKQITWINIPGYETRDFRDIEAFDANSAIVMAIGEPGIILKTTDGGKTWKKVFEDSTKGMFLDALDFDKKGNGVVVGDPINHKLYRAYTHDFGDSWTKDTSLIQLNEQESFFASSGTNIQYNKIQRKSYLFASGGSCSRLFWNNKNYPLALQAGKNSTGANSIALFKNKAIIVGGDFSKDSRSDSNCVIVQLHKKPIFSIPETTPLGYRSCIIAITKNTFVCCGTSGVDVSTDGGKHWRNISKQSFHVVQKAKKGKSIFLAGSNGKIAQLFL
jgi:photosystem II stability/assembly factor-like uncharacterized protein